MCQYACFSYWVGSVEVLECQCWWFCAWLDKLYHNLALGVCPKAVSSVRCENIHSQRGEKRAALTSKVGVLVKKKKAKVCWKGGREGSYFLNRSQKLLVLEDWLY